jgi:hypothetical protein
MKFYEPQKIKNLWMTSPMGSLFDDCRIDWIQLIQGMIDRGTFTQDDLTGVPQYKKKYQSIIFPTPKGQKISEQQRQNLDLISNNQIRFEENCKLVLGNLRKVSNPLLPIEFEIEQCIEFTCIIMPYELNEGIRLYFECDWGDYASGTCSVALQFFDFNKIQECEEEYKKYGL